MPHNLDLIKNMLFNKKGHVLSCLEQTPWCFAKFSQHENAGRVFTFLFPFSSNDQLLCFGDEVGGGSSVSSVIGNRI